MAKRTIILHYHLFKNAGTSVDRILQGNFPDRWVTAEFRGQNNTAQVIDWIRDTPDAVAFSSHTMMGPIPKLPNVDIIPVMLLRDPVARIRSAYRFEHAQQSDNFGAVLARHTDLEGYVRVRLALPGDRQCRNFQTWRLASLMPGPGAELDRATEALKLFTVVGRVENFSPAMARLQDAVHLIAPKFKFTKVHANKTKPNRTDDDPSFVDMLKEINKDDLKLLETVAKSS